VLYDGMVGSRETRVGRGDGDGDLVASGTSLHNLVGFQTRWLVDLCPHGAARRVLDWSTTPCMIDVCMDKPNAAYVH